MKKKKMLCLLLSAIMAASVATGCGNSKDTNADTSADTSADTQTADSSDGAANNGEIKEYTAFFAVPGSEINDDNEIQQIIAEKTGAKVKETWLTGQTAEEAVGTLIAGGEYPDFVDGGSQSVQLYQAGALVALDDYIEKYPNIKELFTEQEWDQLRQDDGHIYWLPQFSNIYGEANERTHTD